MYPHNPRMGPPNARFNELLDQLRSEFDTHIRAGESYEHQSTPLNPNASCDRRFDIRGADSDCLSQCAGQRDATRP